MVIARVAEAVAPVAEAAQVGAVAPAAEAAPVIARWRPQRSRWEQRPSSSGEPTPRRG